MTEQKTYSRENSRPEKYMKEAIRQAKKAGALGEVPIGCVIVRGEEIIARGYNRRNTDKNTLSHAELNAIKKAARKLGDWRLEGCVMYVTLEPCPMCAGALVQSRIDHVVIGCMNPKAGCAGSVLNLLEMDGFNHKVGVTRGVLEEECADLLSSFFSELRQKRKQSQEMMRPRFRGAVFDADRILLETVPEEKARLRPGASELTTWMQSEGVQLSAVTSMERNSVKAVLKRPGLLAYFRKILVRQESAGAEAKLYEKAARCMGTKPEETLVITDVPENLREAVKAGFYPVRICWENEEGEETGGESAELCGSDLLDICDRLKTMLHATPEP